MLSQKEVKPLLLCVMKLDGCCPSQEAKSEEVYQHQTCLLGTVTRYVVIRQFQGTVGGK
jgi:hypothetical protein